MDITLYNDLDLLFAKLSIYGRFKCNLLLDCVIYLRAGPLNVPNSVLMSKINRFCSLTLDSAQHDCEVHHFT